MAFLRFYWPRRSAWTPSVLPDGRNTLGGYLSVLDRFSCSLTVIWERSILDGVVFVCWQISSTPQTDMRYVQLRFALSPSFTRSSQRSARLTVQLSDD